MLDVDIGACAEEGDRVHGATGQSTVHRMK